MISKKGLLEVFRKEYATTVKMMRAFPEDKFDFTPHERSQNTKRLMSTFVFEMYLVAAYVLNQPADWSKFKTYDPEHIGQVIADFEKETEGVLALLDQLPEEELATKELEFGGKRFLADEFVLMMIHDQIHHRGQLSVYVRMAGGKVPSIYGPSADDPSTNL